MNIEEGDNDSQGQKWTWEEIVRLAKGSTEEKERAAVLIIDNSSTRPGEPSKLPSEAWEIVKQLAQPNQPEELRIELARGLKSENIAMGLRHDLEIILKQDPSEVVREQVRVSLEEADMRVLDLGIAREIRPRWWRVSQLKSYLAQRKLDVAVIIAIIIGVAVAFWTRNFNVQRSSLDSLTQANATVFALVFTIPIAAGQFSRYKVSPESFFDAKNVGFFLLYSSAVLLPMVIYDQSWSPLFIGLSAMCITLVFPFLFRLAEILRPTSIVNQTKAKIRRRWNRGELDAAVELEYLAYQALSSKDYDTFSKVISSLAGLVPIWKNTSARYSLHPLQLDVAGLKLTLRRVGEASLGDLNALKIYCYGVLSISTFRRFEIGKELAFEKHVEFELLRALAGGAGASLDGLRIILLYLVGWSVQNRYVDKQDEAAAINECADTLLQHQEELVSEILKEVRRQIEISPLILQFLFPEAEAYVVKGSSFPVLRYHKLRMLSKLELEINEQRVAQKIKGYAPAQADAVNILPATDDVTRQILALQKITYRDEAVAYDDYLLLPLSETLEEVATEFRRKHFLKATMDDKIIGSICGGLDGVTCRISRLMVHPSFRGLDLEERLVTSIENFFQNAIRFEAIVYDKSQNIIAYQKLGYQISKKTELSNKMAMFYLEKHKSNRSLRPSPS